MGKTIDWEEFNQGEIPAVRVKFEKIGDHVAGTVTNVRITDFGGKGERTPELWIRQDDGGEVSMAASQVMLQRELANARPAVGDKIAVVYKGDGKSSRAGMSPPKLFEVKVVRAGNNATPAPTPTPTPPPEQAADSPAPTADSLI
jgi:hypothetical protein